LPTVTQKIVATPCSAGFVRESLTVQSIGVVPPVAAVPGTISTQTLMGS
jgi:hypothetical protein